MTNKEKKTIAITELVSLMQETDFGLVTTVGSVENNDMRSTVFDFSNVT